MATKRKPLAPVKDDLGMMNRPDDWPHWPFLPLKRDASKYRDTGFVYGVLVVTAKPVPPIVYNMNIWHQEPLDKCRKIEYPSLQAALDDGWMVD